MKKVVIDYTFSEAGAYKWLHGAEWMNGRKVDLVDEYTEDGMLMYVINLHCPDGKLHMFKCPSWCVDVHVHELKVMEDVIIPSVFKVEKMIPYGIYAGEGESVNKDIHDPVAAPKSQDKAITTNIDKTVLNKRCLGVTAVGTQCGRKAVVNGYCKQHNK